MLSFGSFMNALFVTPEWRKSQFMIFHCESISQPKARSCDARTHNGLHIYTKQRQAIAGLQLLAMAGSLELISAGS